MDELSLRARRLLEAADGADNPAPGEALRLRGDVLARISSAGLGVTAFSLGLERAKAVLGLAAPKIVLLALISAGGSALYRHSRDPERAVPDERPRSHLSAHRAPFELAATAAPSQALLTPPPSPSPPVGATALHLVRRVPALSPALPVASSKPSALEAEMRFVRAADAALREGDVGEAESALAQHAHEFPTGGLSEERDALRVLAACQRGDAESEQAAAHFVAAAPRSLMAARVRTTCLR